MVEREGEREGGKAYLADGVDGDLHLAHVVEAIEDTMGRGRERGREGGMRENNSLAHPSSESPSFPPSLLTGTSQSPSWPPRQ